MKKSQKRGSSTFKFFIDWALEQSRKNIFFFVALMALSFGGSISYHKYKAPSVAELEIVADPSASSISDLSRAPSSVPSGNPEAVYQASAQNDSPSNRNNESQETPQANNSSGGSGLHSGAGGSTSNGGSGSFYPNSYDNNGGTSDSERSVASEGRASSGSSDTGNGQVYQGGVVPPAAGGTVSSDVTQTTVYVPPASQNFFPLTAGGVYFQLLSGGLIATGTGMRVQSSFGEVTSSGVQSASGLKIISGMKGILYQ